MSAKHPMGFFGMMLHENNYTIIPIAPKGYVVPGTNGDVADGKSPRGLLAVDWRAKYRNGQSEAVVRRFMREHPGWGVGIITGRCVAFDIDVLHPDAAAEIKALALATFGAAPVRIGRAPKSLIVYRTEVPFAKLVSAKFRMPGSDAAHQVEVLGDGQQFVAYGIHPGTGEQYRWEGPGSEPFPVDAPSPRTVHRTALRPVTEQGAREFIAKAEEILRKHGSEAIAGEGEVRGATLSAEAADQRHEALPPGAPPCLHALALDGFGDWQNNGLFNLAVMRKMSDPDDWQDKLRADNDRFMKPALTKKKLDQLIKSVGKKDYRYKCSEEPICKVCSREACLKREFGVGPDPDLDPDVAKLNEKHALVRIGDKVAVMQFDDEISFMTTGTFEQWFGNRFIQRPWMEKAKPLGRYWLTHGQRRQYDGLVFAPGREVPGHYNLWRGFAVEPKPGDCSKFLAHFKDNICQGDAKLYEWGIAWFADIVQNPEQKSGSSLVVRGKEGVGKSKVGEHFGSLFGDHYVVVNDPRYITGRFNSHMASCLLLHAEEAFWAGDHAAEGKLKDLITGTTHFVEYKGKEPIRLRNHLRLFVTGNPDWVVPVSMQGRRFAVYEAGETHLEDHKYFAAIDKEMNEGGREALLHHLLNEVDLEGTDLRTIPKTAALLEQKLASMTPEQGWWMDVLQSGRLPWGCGLDNECPATFLFERYIEHAGKRGGGRRSIETRVGLFLKRVVPGLIKREATFTNYKGGTESGSVYEFPDLKTCREHFAQQLQQEITWDGPADWLPPPEQPDRGAGADW